MRGEGDMASVSELRLRPELVLGPNPFIEAMPPFVPIKEMPDRMQRFPLANIPWRNVPVGSREALLTLAERHFTPCRWAIDIAINLQHLVRRSLILRNPLRPTEKARTFRIGLSQDWEAMTSSIAAERLDGAGARISGVTGTGKTTLIDMVLEIIAPAQVIEYGPCAAAGWNKLVQCVYLRVDHATNGTRGGVMHRILLAFDNALGTDYSIQYSKVTNLDTLLTQVCRLICIHRVALVIIDENQQTTLEHSPWRLEFVLFYLHMMNLGTSVLLSGNPLAFEYMRHFAQVERRFSVGGIHDLEPAPSPDATWWKEDFVRGMRKFDLLDGCSVPEKELSSWEHSTSAGVPGLYRAFRVEAMRAALRRGGRVVKLQAQDLLEAEASATCVRLAKIAASLREDSHSFSDIPGGTGIPRRKSGAHIKPSTGGATIDVVSRALGAHHRQHTRQVNQLKSFLTSMAGLGEEEIRMLGATDELLAMVKNFSKESEARSGRGAARKTAKVQRK